MADVREHIKKITREIEKTSESIHKKHRALKTSKIEESIALDKHFKPLIEPRFSSTAPTKRAQQRCSVYVRERRKKNKRKEKKQARAFHYSA